MDDIYETIWQDVAMFPVRLTPDLLSRLELDVKAQGDGIHGAVFLRHDIPASRVGEPLFVGPGSAAVSTLPETSPVAVEAGRSTPSTSTGAGYASARPQVRRRP